MIETYYADPRPVGRLQSLLSYVSGPMSDFDDQIVANALVGSVARVPITAIVGRRLLVT